MYLASKSPQRRALLQALAIDFEVVLPDYEEVDGEGLLPAQLVEGHSRGKALSVAAKLSPQLPDQPVLGVDTMVAVDGRTVGKAHDEATAREFLGRMSGNIHLVYSGITLVSTVNATAQNMECPEPAPQGQPGRNDEFWREGSSESHWSGAATEKIGDQAVRVDTRHACTEVRFIRLTKADIDAYIATGEWRERAGAYAIQGRASGFVADIRGDYTNVVGLPVSLLVEMLRAINLWPPSDWTSQ